MTEYIPEMKKLYIEKVVPGLKEALGISNIYALPKISKIVINAGLGASQEKAGLLEQAMRDLTLLAGQRPIFTLAHKSIAGFKIRTGMQIGAKVTLRGNRMYDFLSRFLNIAVPRMRDFRGFMDKSIDGRGNFSFGITEHNIFPEVALADKEQPFSMQVTIVINAKDKEQGKLLLEKFGFPFVKE